MLSSVVAILAAVGLLMPGFIITELSSVGFVRSSRSDLELALRALAFTLIIQLVFGFWTANLVKTVGPMENWVNHVGAISTYVVVVLLGIPIAAGFALNRFIARAEKGPSRPGLLATGLGAGGARDAFDFAYQHWRAEGAWVIVELTDGTPQAPRLVGGVFGRQSAVGQTPQPHDIYLEALCTVDVDQNGIRSIGHRVEPARGIYIAADQIARIDLVPAGPATLES